MKRRRAWLTREDRTHSTHPRYSYLLWRDKPQYSFEHWTNAESFVLGYLCDEEIREFIGKHLPKGKRGIKRVEVGMGLIKRKKKK